MARRPPQIRRKKRTPPAEAIARSVKIETPFARRIRVFAFDPSLATQLETTALNQITLSLPWETGLGRGPVGEYIEVVDYDPASGTFYEPVDLGDPFLLAQDGLVPSESNPQFHQQMVYAVAMTTIRHFERALGRVAFWADHRIHQGGFRRQFVRRLRIYPHALRAQNAYYSPEKKAVLFGYFPVVKRDGYNTPGTVVFTCLSHGIIAHEVTHALLDGVHPRFNEPSNPDVYAFHEAFADIVAVFQHFSYPSILESQISRTKGSLGTENLLSQLAQQFGQATGRGSSLRDALGETNKVTGNWEPREPDPLALQKIFNAHDRGAVLVAAVFRAFLLIYRARSADLFRIATGGTGLLPPGEMHPDLTKRLASEAAKSADRILQMCIRAIDYCPPVDITFGDFLRGAITADLDYNPDDEGGYRTVFIQSFREWGIHPRGITSIGIDALAWPSGEDLMRDLVAARRARHDEADRRNDLKTNFLGTASKWNLESDRYAVWNEFDILRRRLWSWIYHGDSYGREYARLFGLVIDSADAPATVYRSQDGVPSIEIHSVRPAVRRSLNGNMRIDLVVEVTQRRRGYFDPKKQQEMDKSKKALSSKQTGDFTYRAGCTVLIDPATQEVRRVIRTIGTISDDEELERVRRFRTGETQVRGNAFEAGLSPSLKAKVALRNEPFALLHQGWAD